MGERGEEGDRKKFLIDLMMVSYIDNAVNKTSPLIAK